ncbi:uncharacterized protein EI90DRAFT_2929991 [Cantharellus anzutake]|uniref:uncharacterized protein n=1 Tax=Cantharellus anzutake TaxID=1750568 RepID=UPI0019077C0F|nr:uncharacterized protein EI90DRAFT_2929991 [Cantharellus anzutake]KAF8326627.1 hypothetical protein EI90DRAFT_2929991 [Cantharellus anzutake]
MRLSFTIPNSPPTKTFVDLLNTYVEHAFSIFDHVRFSITTRPPSPKPSHNKVILDIFDLTPSESTSLFIHELEELVNAIEASADVEHENSFLAFTINGLKHIEKEHGRSSDVYKAAVRILKGIISKVGEMSKKQKLALLVIPDEESRLISRSSKVDDTKREPEASERSIPIVHSKSQCFTSAEACTNATSSCSGRGECIKTTRAGKSCFSCSCHPTTDQYGRTITWAGQMCERKDISVPFILLAGTTIFLIAIAIGSVSLLYAVGEVPLPNTLTVTTTGGHLKRE